MANIEAGTTDDFRDTGDVDPVAEADVYMAYGRHKPAEEILLGAIKREPNRLAILFKLGELYSETREASKFKQVIARLKSLTQETDEAHFRALELERLFEEYSPRDKGSMLDPAEREDASGVLGDQGPTYAEQVAVKDLLNRDRITSALAKLLIERTGTQPISIGLFGPWGSGKSSQISFLKQRLGEGGAIKTSIFNAWEYEHSESIGAALAQTVVEDLLRNLGLWEQLKIATRLAAVENSKVLDSAKQDATTLYGAILQWSSIIPFLLIPAAIGGVLCFLFFDWISKSELLQVVSGVFVALGSVWVGVRKFLDENLFNWIKKERSQSTISRRLGLPDFRNKIGVHYEIRTALRQICDVCIEQSSDPKKGGYLLLVIDDLDRCSPSVVKNTLDAVRLVANVERIVTLVAIDPRIAYSAAIKHFEQFPLLGRSREFIAREYLAKVFQVSLTLPSATASTTRKFIYEELFHGAFRSSELDRNGIVLDSGAELNEVHQKMDEFLASQHYKSSLPEEVEMFFMMSSACGFSNPRQLWRLKQAWQLMKGISFEEGIGLNSIKAWMRALFLCEYLLQSETDEAVLIVDWLSNQSNSAPDLLVRLAMEDEISSAFSDYYSRAQVVKYVLLPSAS